MPTRHPTHPCENGCGATTTNRRFCSNACSLTGTATQRAAATTRPPSSRSCPVCGESIKWQTSQTCSRKCGAQLRDGPTPPCAWCGSLERSGRRRRTKFCSWTCWNEDRYYRSGPYAQWVTGWLSGEISGTTPQGEPDRRIRWALIELRGQRCEECGWDKVNPRSGRVPLHVDHTTGDRSRNRPEDLRVLCPNCHSLTPNYMHLNNPAVRPVRKIISRRYAEIWQSSAAAP